MKIFKLLLIIVFIGFILQGCSTQEHSDKIKTEFSPANEFLQIEDADPKYIMAKEPGIIIVKGVFLGKIKKRGTQYYNLQFTGMLNGKNRVLDMYIQTENKSFPIVKEVDKMKQGKPAFLFEYCDYNSLEETISQFDKFFTPYIKKYKDPKVFFDFIKYDKGQIPDTTFFIGLNYDSPAYPKSRITSNIYFKKDNGNFIAKRVFSKESDAYYNLKLEYKIRNKNKMYLSLFKYVYTVLWDIVMWPYDLYKLNKSVNSIG